MSFGFVVARAHYCRTISRRRRKFDRRCATFRCRCTTSPCFVARLCGGSPTFGLYLTGWARCLAICSTLDEPSLIFPPRCAQNCPEVSKFHTARKTEQVIVRLILRERDYVWYRTFESPPTTFVGRPSFLAKVLRLPAENITRRVANKQSNAEQPWRRSDLSAPSKRKPP